ncbi:inositol monophosphatase family protein [Streptomyces sp. NPDC046197]|uniref:inositol monophosphatase family protein n=1 Tax=Streptomyces sp. NPDC046197 TaxID=3154337 RepID=UPI0033E3146A
MTLAHRLSDQAEIIAQRHLSTAGIAVQTKIDGSPATAADHEIEQALRSMISREHPADAFLGEEFGAHGSSTHRWIIDAIDGTASFLAGEPEWSTLIALEEHGSVSMGMVSAPALHRRWWAACGSGAWTSTYPAHPAAPPQRLTITGATKLHEARIGIWPPPSRLSEADRAMAAELAARAAQTRPALDWGAPQPTCPPPPKPSTGSGTCHGALLVATGHLDAFLLLGAGPWDIAALVPIIKEAGGAFSDLSGTRETNTKAALFSNISLHGQILDTWR